MKKTIHNNEQNTLEQSFQKFAYTINETAMSESGEYIPCIVKEGEGGYYLTDWTWGKDKAFAESIAKDRNERMGLDSKAVMQLVCESMFKYVK